MGQKLEDLRKRKRKNLKRKNLKNKIMGLKIPKVKGGGPKGRPNANQRLNPKSKTVNPSKRKITHTRIKK